MNKVTIYRLKSDNFDCFVSEEAYQAIQLQMSSGDFGSHIARAVEVDPNQLENLRFHSGRDFVDYQLNGDEETPCWFHYTGDGDCIVEPDVA